MLLTEIFNLHMPKFLQKTQGYDDSKVKHKAGLLPFFKHNDNTIEFLFMVSSDPKFGGPDPMISKGGVDPGEDIKQAAIRESEEELGLKPGNIISPLTVIYNEQISGLKNSYHMTFFMCQVNSKTDFGTHHYETAHTVWMTNEQFQLRGRNSHKPIVKRAYNLVTGS